LKQCCYHEEISVKTTIAGSNDSENRNTTQDNGNINISGKAVAGFAFNAWGPFVISYDRTTKMAVWKTTFVSEHLNTDQS